MASTIVEENVIAEAASETSSSARPSLLAPLKVRNFRLLWLAEGISLLGDQFHFVALPWLVLQLTGSGLAVGSVLAVTGIPRALFMLVGGALTDRFSPRAVMLISNLTRAMIVGLMTVMVVTGLIQLWMLYVMALLFGFLDGFFLPAQGAMLPRIVEKDHLEPANAITQITAQLSQFVGPALAGLVIASFAGNAVSEGTASTEGIAIALGFDTLTFIFAAAAIWMITHVGRVVSSGKTESASAEAAEAASSQGLLSSIREGLQTVWQDEVIRVMVFLSGIINFLINGTISVGLPVLASLRFEEGAAAFGLMISGFGGGALAGALAAGMLPRPRRFGVTVTVLVVNFGIGFILLNNTFSLPLALLIGAGMGVGAGYTNVVMSAWMQRRTDPSVMGRVMGIVMLASMGLQPISMMLAGFMVDISLDAMFVGAGLLLILTGIVALTLRPIRELS